MIHGVILSCQCGCRKAILSSAGQWLSMFPLLAGVRSCDRSGLRRLPVGRVWTGRFQRRTWPKPTFGFRAQFRMLISKTPIPRPVIPRRNLYSMKENGLRKSRSRQRRGCVPALWSKGYKAGRRSFRQTATPTRSDVNPIQVCAVGRTTMLPISTPSGWSIA